MTAEKTHSEIFDETEAAQFLRVSTRTLQSWRVSGRGPEFIKVGRVIRYRRQTLEMWLDLRTR
ncbi:MAG: helix-turn-helix domain-containing protein, partial [Beijerinckiaceae bacterium]|nr:helix-turn-helix domain-containing protein [Beijerinckiaceae bacterium]